MLGKPKYKENQLVSFMLGEEVKEGLIYIVDRYGTFEDNSDVSYDIYVGNENTLYKHINEKYVIKQHMSNNLLGSWFQRLFCDHVYRCEYHTYGSQYVCEKCGKRYWVENNSE